MTTDRYSTTPDLHPLVPENGQPLTTFKLEIGQALLYLPPAGSVADDVTVAPVRVAIVRFTPQSIVLRFPDGVERRRKPSYWNLFFASWCPDCARPAHDEAGQLVCGRCDAPCAGLPPAHIFPATVTANHLECARRKRLMAERGWTNKQAWDRVYGPIRGPNRLGEGLRAWMAGDRETFDRIGEEQRQWWAQKHAELRLPLPPVSPFETPPLCIVRDAGDCEPDGADDLTRWLDQQFDQAA